MANLPPDEAFALLTSKEREAILYAMQPREIRGAFNQAAGVTNQQRSRALKRARRVLLGG